MKVLLIEDDQYIIDDLKYYLIESGLDCTVYSSPDVVLENFNTISEYRYIILDIMLKRGAFFIDRDSDWETGEILYQEIIKKFPQSKFIIISAKQFNDMVINFSVENNVKMVVKKPFDVQMINKIIATIKVG